jgi:hypothetical protein
MKIEAVYLESSIVLYGRQPKIIRMEDECHVTSMDFEQGDTCMSIVDHSGKLHIIPLTNVTQMIPAVVENKKAVK